MIARFQGGARPAGCAAAAAPAAQALPSAGTLPQVPGQVAGAGGAADPLAPVLAGLVGQEIAVFAGGRMYCGKLLQNDPTTLVSHGGQVQVLTVPADSVQF